MIRLKKIRLLPSDDQQQKLWQSVGTARFIYNWTLARQQANYNSGGKFINDNELRKEITHLKKTDLIWLNEVSNNVAKQAVKDSLKACQVFLDSKAGENLKLASTEKLFPEKHPIRYTVYHTV